MKGLFFYKLVSPYQEDVTKDCKLTVNEIDSNFLNLKDADIKNASFDKDTNVIKLTRNNDEDILVDLSSALGGVISDFSVSYDSKEGVIELAYDGKVVSLGGIVTKDNLGDSVITEVASDSTLIGKGAKRKPLGIASVEKTGHYKPALKYVDIENGEELPTLSHRAKGDRYVIHDVVDDYGYLYNFATVKKIMEDLEGGWKIPSKEDWDDMLNAIEPCDEYRNHDLSVANTMLGKYAGKYLKSNHTWKELSDSDEDYIDSTETTTETDEVGDGTSIVKTVVTKKTVNPIGTDNYGMGLMPCGEYDDDEDIRHFLRRGLYWSSTQCHVTDVYVKRFDYDKSGVVQTVESPINYFSLRLMKVYDGTNHNGMEFINGMNYDTILLPSISSEYGHNIWTKVNVSFNNEGYSYKQPNLGDDIAKRDVYIVLDWNGEDWDRKQMSEGESIVFIDTVDGRHDISYRVVNGKLICESDILKQEILDEIQPELDKIEELDQKLYELARNVEENHNAISQALEEEIARSTEKDEELENKLNETIDRLDAEIERSSNADERLINSGSYDSENGTLTLVADNEENNITIQFNGNCGTF